MQSSEPCTHKERKLLLSSRASASLPAAGAGRVSWQTILRGHPPQPDFLFRGWLACKSVYRRRSCACFSFHRLSKTQGRRRRTTVSLDSYQLFGLFLLCAPHLRDDLNPLSCRSDPHSHCSATLCGGFICSLTRTRTWSGARRGCSRSRQTRPNFEILAQRVK